MCAVNSSTMAASRPGSNRKAARRIVISFFQSGIFCPHYAADRRHEFVPACALERHDFAAFRRQAVVAPAALARLFDPPALHQSSRFQPIKDRIQCRYMKRQRPAGAGGDELAEVVTVARLRLEERED